MRPNRQRLRLFRLVAVLLLAWTAVDLGAAQLCALDREGTQTVGGVCSVSVAEDSCEKPVGLFHIDDCFCCSHCVNLSVVVPLLADLQLIPFRPLSSLGPLQPMFDSVYRPPHRS